MCNGLLQSPLIYYQCVFGLTLFHEKSFLLGESAPFTTANGAKVLEKVPLDKRKACMTENIKQWDFFDGLLLWQWKETIWY
jgi:hypothetical protein